MPLEILSLDLDWFNSVSYARLDALSGYKPLNEVIPEFFTALVSGCSLPPVIHVLTEHHYLYPLALSLGAKSNHKLNVVNIDEHHDFYNLDWVVNRQGAKVSIDRIDAIVDCANFFAFMANNGLINKYTWITQSIGRSQVSFDRRDIRSNIRLSASEKVKGFQNNVVVRGSSDLLKVVAKKKFDAFIIVRSPNYTKNREEVYRLVQRSLATTLTRHRVKQFKHTAKFPIGLIQERVRIFR